MKIPDDLATTFRNPLELLRLLAFHLRIPGIVILLSTGVSCTVKSNWESPVPASVPVAERNGGISRKPEIARDQDYPRPVILIHGAMGSRLVDRESGRLIWGIFKPLAARKKVVNGFRSIALPMGPGGLLHEMKDEVEPDGTMRFIQIGNNPVLPLKINFYAGVLRDMRRDLRKSPEASDLNLTRKSELDLDFDYDWRRSIDENAELLDCFIIENKRRFVEKHGFPENMRFDAVAHSQGCLLLRYYLRYGGKSLPQNPEDLPAADWKGARHFDSVAMLAPPNRGMGRVIPLLTEGHQPSPILPAYPAAVTGTMPALYQMLPRAEDGVLLDPETGRYLDPLDFSLWVERSWGLANPTQDEALRILLPGVKDAGQRRTMALDHLEKCLLKARQFQRALDRPSPIPDHLNVHIFTGRSIETSASFLAHRFEPTLFKTAPGDNSVVLSSSLQSPDLDSPNGNNPLLHIHSWDCSHSSLVRKPVQRRNVLDELANK